MMSKNTKKKNNKAMTENNNNNVISKELSTEPKTNTRIDKLHAIFNSMKVVIKEDRDTTSKEYERLESLYHSFPSFYSDILKNGVIRTGKTGLLLFNTKMNAEMSNHERTKRVYNGLLTNLECHLKDSFNKKYGSGQISKKGEKQTLTYIDYCCVVDSDLVKDFVRDYIENSIAEYEEEHYGAMIKLMFVNYIDTKKSH